jgi:hypothetical protein
LSPALSEEVLQVAALPGRNVAALLFLLSVGWNSKDSQLLDASITSLVVTGRPPFFSAGADISEFLVDNHVSKEEDASKNDVSLVQLCDALEASPKPSAKAKRAASIMVVGSTTLAGTGEESADEIAAAAATQDTSTSTSSSGPVPISRGGAIYKLPPLPAPPTMAQFRKFALPCLALWVAGPLLSLVDTSFVGLSGDSTKSAMQLAALGPATTFIDGSTYLFAFLNVATTNLYASARAASGDESSAKSEAVVRTASRVAVISGLGLMALLLTCSRPLLSLYIGTFRSVPFRSVSITLVVKLYYAADCIVSRYLTDTPILALFYMLCLPFQNNGRGRVYGFDQRSDRVCEYSGSFHAHIVAFGGPTVSATWSKRFHHSLGGHSLFHGY